MVIFQFPEDYFVCKLMLESSTMKSEDHKKTLLNKGNMNWD